MCDSWPVTGESTIPRRSPRCGRASGRRAPGFSRRSRQGGRPRTSGRGRRLPAAPASPAARRARSRPASKPGSREPEDERRIADSERHGLSGPHGDTPEHLLDTELGLDPPHEVMRPDRDTARGDERVVPEPRLQRPRCAPSSSATEPSRVDLRAGRCELGGEHHSVRLVDLAGAERSAGLAKLRSRRQYRYPRAAAQTTSATPAAASAPICAAPSRIPAAATTAPAETSRPGSRMFSPPATAVETLDAVALLDNKLVLDHCVRALGDEPARRDSHRLTGCERSQRRRAGSDPMDDRQLARRVRGA